MKKPKVTRLDYCQYLMVSQINYTITNYADHHPENISHDRINRYIKGDKLKPRLVWEEVKQDIEPPRDCRRLNFLREYDNENTKLYP